jgi:hypothetical protein
LLEIKESWYINEIQRHFSIRQALEAMKDVPMALEAPALPVAGGIGSLAG